MSDVRWFRHTVACATGTESRSNTIHLYTLNDLKKPRRSSGDALGVFKTWLGRMRADGEWLSVSAPSRCQQRLDSATLQTDIFNIQLKGAERDTGNAWVGGKESPTTSSATQMKYAS
jgi:hypothetical protein